MFITESWFWRGTQSAIFYYVSCSPYVEFKYKRRRRKEADKAKKEKNEIVTQQPGILLQPGPFQTNPDWAEEIIKGPGPPKGWKKEKILQGYSESAREKYRNETQTPSLPLHVESTTVSTDFAPRTERNSETHTSTGPAITASMVSSDPTCAESSSKQRLPRRSSIEPMSAISEIASNTVVSDSSSNDIDDIEQQSRPRPSMERRLSSAVENIKDTIKGWNLKRYEREDEILSGLNERLSRMWDRATQYGNELGTEGMRLPFTSGRKRAPTAGTTESDRYDYQRAVRNPEINDLHPPTVSKLPATSDDAAWMLLPPPSAAVMAGRARPQDEPALRWPMAVIGRDQIEPKQFEHLEGVVQSRPSRETTSTSNSELKHLPDLSHSSSEEDAWSEEEKDNDSGADEGKRHSAPVDGWIPIKPRPTAQILHSTMQHRQGEVALGERRAV